MISALLSFAGKEAAPTFDFLLARGWQALDQIDCENLREGNYYEIENEERSVEALFMGKEAGFLASSLPLPEAPYLCRTISQPQFIEELK